MKKRLKKKSKFSKISKIEKFIKKQIEKYIEIHKKHEKELTYIG